MNLTVKILLPFFIVLAVVFGSINYFSVQIFDQFFLENKALTLGDHANREAKVIFRDANFKQASISAQTQEQFGKLVREVEEPSVFRIKVWDKDGRIVYSDKRNLVGAVDSPNLGLINNAFKQKIPVSWRFEQVARNSSDAGYGPFLKIMVPVQDDYGNTYYVLGLYSATSTILSNIRNLINETFLIMAGAAILIYISTNLIVHFIITRRLRRLQRIVNKVSKGDFSYESKDKSSDEIGSLGKSFENMRLQLKNSVENMMSSNYALEEQSSQLKEQLAELEKFQKLTVDRELKMVELKEKLQGLKSQQEKKNPNK